MHQALFIDELLREIFHWSAVSGGRDLPLAARTCRAWRDPALDALYQHISSVKPLLALFSSTQQDNFFSYARRVKHLVHSTKNYGALSFPQLECLFPLLQSAKVTLPSKMTCSVPPSVSLAPGLRELYIDEGFYARKMQENTSEYLRQALLVAPRLDSLTFRGLASAQTNILLSGMRNLRILRLRTAHTLTVVTLASIALFPRLQVLEVHAKEISPSALEDLWSSQPLFPALENLWIRCTPELFSLLMAKIQSIRLHTLYLDLETKSHTTSFWHSLFDQIGKITTLQDLSIMHLLDHDDATYRVIRDINTIGMRDIRPLAQCHNIRRLDIGTTFPVNLCDSDFTHLVKWWPDMESLEFSAEVTNDCSDVSPRITCETLHVISTWLPKLAYLALPVDTSGVTVEAIGKLDVPGQRALKTLSIMFPHLPDAALLPRFLYSLFPNLPEVEYASEQWFADWAQVTSGVRGLQNKNR